MFEYSGLSDNLIFSAIISGSQDQREPKSVIF